MKENFNNVSGYPNSALGAIIADANRSISSPGNRNDEPNLMGQSNNSNPMKQNVASMPSHDEEFNQFVNESWNQWTHRKSDKTRENVEEEKRKLFSPYVESTSRKKRGVQPMEQCFTFKQVILLKRSNKQTPPSLSNMHFHYNADLVRDSVSIPKHYTAIQVKTLLAAKFARHLLRDAEFSILKKEGQRLVVPNNRDLNGLAVSIIFNQKRMFLRRKTDLLLLEDELFYSEDELDVKPQKVNTGLKRKSSFPDYLDFNFDCEWRPVSPLNVNDISRDQPRTRTNCTYVPPSSSMSEDEKEEETERPLLSTLVSNLAEQVTDEDQASIYVYRSNIFHSSAIGLNSSLFSADKRLYIVFLDDLGKQEEGIDAGGLTQEFFALNLEYVRKSDMLSGPEFKRDLNLCENHLSAGDYKTAGKLFALSFAHKASQPQFFSSHLYDSIISGKYCRKLTIQNIQNVDVRMAIETLSAMESSILIKDFVSNSQPLKEQNWAEKFSTKDVFMNDLLEYYINEQLQAPFQELIEGLETFNFLEMLKSNPSVWRECFVKTVKPLTSSNVQSLFDIKWSQDAEEKKRQLPALTKLFYFMNELERGVDGYGLSDLLSFATGYTSEPAGGFDRKITIKFVENDDHIKRRPEAASCAFEMYLPTWSATSEEFKEIFYQAFTAKGFLKP